MKVKDNNRSALLRRVTAVGVAGNVLLCLFKLAAGLLASSGAMVSDAVHSASDVLGTAIAAVGMHIAGKAADREHPYGHDRFESVASLLLAMALFITGALIGWSGLQKIFSASWRELEPPGVLALVAAAVSIVSKEIMYRYTISASRRLNSTVLRASAWDHRSDALSSIGSFAGILGARLGLPVLDPIAGVVICLFILKVAVDIFREAVSQTVDRACEPEITEHIRQVVSSQPGVEGVDLLQTRRFGSGIYVDTEISADGNLTLTRAHEIAEAVHAAVEQAEPAVRHCMVHVNPK